MVPCLMKLSLSLSLLVFILSFFNSVVQAHQSYQVLAVHSYSQGSPWTRSQHSGFVNKLTEKSLTPVNISTEYLGTKRRNFSPIYAKQFLRYIREKYRGYTPNVIYVTDDNGFRFAKDYLRELYPDTPIIFSGVNNYNVIDGIKSLPIRGVF